MDDFEVEIHDGDVDTIWSIGKTMIIGYYYYIFGIIHFESDINIMTRRGLKSVCLFRKDIDVGAFEECILDA